MGYKTTINKGQLSEEYYVILSVNVGKNLDGIILKYVRSSVKHDAKQMSENYIKNCF